MGICVIVASVQRCDLLCLCWIKNWAPYFAFESPNQILAQEC